ncbi:hypothetical protein BZG02_00525 [Labilibaculum filiforme]|uniref:Uncharacterized protein n=1 Tax=Labilibaculum filiforme TaxID=1940526 RepID=A0A2N3I5E9_9BACT|nr:hypothetical protein BZG02_00525 [Labilibaculum filiforme]
MLEFTGYQYIILNIQLIFTAHLLISIGYLSHPFPVNTLWQHPNIPETVSSLAKKKSDSLEPNFNYYLFLFLR